MLSSLLFEVIIVALEEIVKRVPSTLLKLGLVIVKVPMAAYFARSYTYPFRLVSNVMAVNGSGLAAAGPHLHWMAGVLESVECLWQSISWQCNTVPSSSTQLPKVTKREEHAV